jgi:hypothetical protein
LWHELDCCCGGIDASVLVAVLMMTIAATADSDLAAAHVALARV